MSDVTRLLGAWRSGDAHALDQLIPLVYEDLRRLAQGMAYGRGAAGTQATALVHELYVRLAGQTHPDIQSRAHFFAVASRAMRQILVDRARRVQAQRRGGGAEIVPLDEFDAADTRASEMLELDDALNRLAELHPRRAQVIELRYFGGLGAEETAETLGVSSETVRRETRLAEAWLADLLGPVRS
ncbi:MAG: sigma-70 family RNA polymerase sigma factor [Acidobacteria bacterium]|nr:sigma-70 family RNA polymerase sigma factor [Acidobacteriota bacterium]